MYRRFARTTLYCGAVKQAIAREIDERNRHLSSVHSWLLGIGSVAAFSLTIYSGVVAEPHKEVLMPVGAIAGSALVSALPSLGKDERADALRQKLASIQAKEAAAMTALTTMEHFMSDLSILELQLRRFTTKAESLPVLVSREKKYTENQPAEDALRAALVALANECS